DVTPQRSIAFASWSESTWTWASTKPGTIHFPETSSIRASAGRARRADAVALPTETIRSPEMTTKEFGTAGDPVPSMSVAPRNAIVAARTFNPPTFDVASCRDYVSPDPKYLDRRASVSVRREGPFGRPREEAIRTLRQDTDATRLHVTSFATGRSARCLRRLDYFGSGSALGDRALLLPLLFGDLDRIDPGETG